MRQVRRTMTFSEPALVQAHRVVRVSGGTLGPTPVGAGWGIVEIGGVRPRDADVGGLAVGDMVDVEVVTPGGELRVYSLPLLQGDDERPELGAEMEAEPETIVVERVQVARNEATEAYARRQVRFASLWSTLITVVVGVVAYRRGRRAADAGADGEPTVGGAAALSP